MSFKTIRKGFLFLKWYERKEVRCLDVCKVFGTRKAEVLNSLIINTTAKANDTTDILQTFR